MSERPMSSNAVKYRTGNPLVRLLIGRFLDAVVEAVRASGAKRVYDIGCGEGIVAARLHEAMPGLDYRGFDLRPDAVEAARNKVPAFRFEVADLFEAPLEPGWADWVICLEVLEHLRDPAAAVHRLAGVAGHGGLFSVPWEPWFRLFSFARGKYWRTWGNHPEHIQHFGPRSFETLLNKRFPATRVSRGVFPWLLATVEREP